VRVSRERGVDQIVEGCGRLVLGLVCSWWSGLEGSNVPLLDDEGLLA
jgi:hypothetical protein